MNVEIAQVLTQIVAFLAMFAILRRYAWGPLMAVMDERRSAIQSSFDCIEEQKAELEHLKKEYRKRSEALDRASQEKMAEATRQAQVQAQEIAKAAHAQAKVLIANAEEEITRDVRRAKEQLKEQVVTLAIEAAQKVIGEELNHAKQKRLVEDFVERADFR